MFFLPLILLIVPALADTATDTSRLGSYYTSLPLYRGAGTNVFVVGVGTPPQEVNLTVCEFPVPICVVIGPIKPT